MYGINFIKEEILKKNKKVRISLRKDIQSLYEVAEELKSKKTKSRNLLCNKSFK